MTPSDDDSSSSSSAPSLSLLPSPMQRPRARPSDVFRPNLPLDPFTHLDNLQPWSIPAHVLSSVSPKPLVIMALGEPSQADLLPLLSAPSLSSSLVLIASHLPPPIPLHSSALAPTVRILRLPAPLDVHNSGAVRLVSLLERAQRFATLWRQGSLPTEPRLQQLTENGPSGEFTIIEEYKPSYPSPPLSTRRTSPLKVQTILEDDNITRYPSPAPSNASQSSLSLFRFHSKSSSSPASPASSTSSLNYSKLNKASRKQTDLQQHPFDAILNFISSATQSSLSDKAVLKNAILITTISAPFLVEPPGSMRKMEALDNRRKETETTNSNTRGARGRPSSAHSHSNVRRRDTSRFSVFTRLSTSSSASEPTETSRSDPRRTFSLLRQHPRHSPSPSVSERGSDTIPFPVTPSHMHLDNDITPAKTHIIHVLPSYMCADNIPNPSLTSRSNTLMHRYSASSDSSKPKIVQSIEQFLLSFAYSISSPPRSPSSTPPTSYFGPTGPTWSPNAQEKAVPYLIPEGVLGSSLGNPLSRLSTSSTLVIGEALLLGILDTSAEVLGWSRAWIRSSRDVVVQAGNLGTPKGKEREMGPTNLESPTIIPAESSFKSTRTVLTADDDQNSATNTTKNKPASSGMRLIIPGSANQQEYDVADVGIDQEDAVANDKGKGKMKETSSPRGLPTPPESSSSHGSDDGSAEGEPNWMDEYVAERSLPKTHYTPTSVARRAVSDVGHNNDSSGPAQTRLSVPSFLGGTGIFTLDGNTEQGTVEVSPSTSQLAVTSSNERRFTFLRKDKGIQSGLRKVRSKFGLQRFLRGASTPLQSAQ